MQYTHGRLGALQLVGGKDETVLDAVVFILVQEAFLLNTCHIEHVEVTDDLLERSDLAVRDTEFVADLLLHVPRELQFIRRDEYDIYILEFRESLDERVDGTAKLKVSAETDRKVVEASDLALDGQEVGQRLRRVGMRAVAGIDDRCTRVERRDEGGTLYRVAHGDNVSKTIDDTRSVSYGLALAHRRRIGVGEPDDIASELHHGRCEAKTCSCRRLIEEGCEFAALAAFGILLAVVDDIEREVDNLVKFLRRKVGRVYEVTHPCENLEFRI